MYRGRWSSYRLWHKGNHIHGVSSVFVELMDTQGGSLNLFRSVAKLIFLLPATSLVLSTQTSLFLIVQPTWEC
jgi:hypothetical protein